jgi:hypothetical protein
MMYGTSDRFVVAARRPAYEQDIVGLRRLLNVIPKARGHCAVTKKNSVGAVSRLAKELLSHREFVLQLVVAPLKVFLQIADGKVRSDPGEHFLRLERLVDEIDRAELETPHLLAWLRQRRQKDDCAVACDGISLQKGARLEAVHIRHHDIQQDQVRDDTLRDGDRVFAAPCGEQAVTMTFERLIQHLKVRGVVIHQQDLRSVRLL